MAQASTAMLDIDAIDIEDGLNARTQFDEEELERLAGSIGEDGVLQPILVRPKGDGRFWLTAGERRLRGARKEGLPTIPALIRERTRGEAMQDSLLENMHKAPVNIIDEARGVQAFAEELGLRTKKEIAEKLKRKPSEIGLMLRLIKLPEGVQRHVAAGTVPTSAERQLREVARVSPRIAECVCDLAARNKVKKSEFTRDFDQLLLQTADARFSDSPTMIRAGRVRFGEVITDKKNREELTSRFNAALPSWSPQQDDPAIKLNDAELDAARALHCLVEYVTDHRHMIKRVAIVTDKEVAADLIEQRIERMEAEAAERDEGREDDKDVDERKAAEGKKRSDERKQREKDKLVAEQFNEELLSGLMNRTAAARRKHDLSRKKAIAKILISNNPDLAVAGLRYVRPALKDVEEKTTKAGEPRRKVSYATGVQANAWLIDRIDSAKSGAEVDDLLTEAIVCALVADRKAVAASNRFGWRCLVSGEVRELLAPEIEDVSPKRPGAKKTRTRRRRGGKGAAK